MAAIVKYRNENNKIVSMECEVTYYDDSVVAIKKDNKMLYIPLFNVISVEEDLSNAPSYSAYIVIFLYSFAIFSVSLTVGFGVSWVITRADILLVLMIITAIFTCIILSFFGYIYHKMLEEE